MLADYLIIASATAIASLTWWAWLDDHPSFHAWVKKLPFIGKPLNCSFCFPMWLAFFAALLFDLLTAPIAVLAPWSGFFGVLVRFGIEWFSLGAGVLLIRHTIFALREIGAVYNHQHKQNHER